MDLKDGFPLLVDLPGEKAIEFLGEGRHSAEIFQADGHLADFHLAHAQNLHRIFDMDISIPSPGTGGAFQNSGNLELLAVDRTVLVGGHDDDHIPELRFHPPGEEFREKNFPLVQGLLPLR